MEAMSSLRRILVLCLLLALLILGWLSWREAPSRRQLKETAEPIISKQPVNFASRTFDPASPPPDMPPLTAGKTRNAFPISSPTQMSAGRLGERMPRTRPSPSRKSK